MSISFLLTESWLPSNFPKKFESIGNLKPCCKSPASSCKWPASASCRFFRGKISFAHSQDSWICDLAFLPTLLRRKQMSSSSLLQEFQRQVEYLKKNKDKIQTKCKWIQSYFFFDINRILFSDFRKIGQDCNFLLKGGIWFYESHCWK